MRPPLPFDPPLTIFDPIASLPEECTGCLSTFANCCGKFATFYPSTMATMLLPNRGERSQALLYDISRQLPLSLASGTGVSHSHLLRCSSSPVFNQPASKN